MKLNKYSKSLIVIAIYLLLYYLMWKIHYTNPLASILYVVNTILMIPGMIPAALFAPNFHLINPSLTLIFNCLIYGLLTFKYYNKKEQKIEKEIKAKEVFGKYSNISKNTEQVSNEE